MYIKGRALDISTTSKLAPLLAPCRYKFISGGRASGKTTFAAAYFVAKALTKRARLLCGREIQKSIKHSNYQSIKKAARSLGVEHLFKFTLDRIICTQTGSEILFQGLWANTDQILSMEDIKYVWLEQAESISEESLELLTPTIRTPGSEILATYNPRYPSDAIERLADRVRGHSCEVTINYDDNPHFPAEMEIERHICETKAPDSYGHIWKGLHRQSNVERTVLPYNLLLRAVGAADKLRYLGTSYGYAGVDVADGGADKPSLAVRYGSTVVLCKELNDKNGNEIANTVLTELGRYRIARCHYDVTGVGASMKAEFYRRNKKYGGLPFTPDPFLFGGKIQGETTTYLYPFSNKDYFSRANAQGYWNLRLRLDNTIRMLDGQTKGVDLNYCLFLPKNTPDKILRELSQVVYDFDGSDKLRINKQPKQEGTNIKMKSPNLADAIMMAFSRDIYRGLKAF